MLYKEYIGNIRALIDRLENTQGENIQNVAAIMIDTVMNNGIIHAFGTGHSQMMAMELFYRAGGLVPVNAILSPALSLAPRARLSTDLERLEGLAEAVLDSELTSPGDCILIASNSGRNAAPVEMAMAAKKKGMKVIALTALEFSKTQPSRHSSGRKLYELADVVLDNLGEPGDACVALKDGWKTGPTSTIAGALLLQAVAVQAAGMLQDAGKSCLWVSANVEGSALGSNDEMIRRYRDRIRGL